MKIIYFTIVSVIFISCRQNTTIPKPNAFLKLEYPVATYKTTTSPIAYQFQYSDQANFDVKQNQWGNISYPKLKAEINITYQPVDGNLVELVRDAEKLTYKHTIKADGIEVYPFEDIEKKVYARLFTLTGDVASPLQFQVTDSVKNFLYGSLYFKTVPNYDSVLPAIDYVKKDITHLIESLEWLE